MHSSTVRLLSLAALVAAIATTAQLAGSPSQTPSQIGAAPAHDPRALEGEWIYVEDRTAGRPVEEHQPSLAARLFVRLEPAAIVVARGTATDARASRMPLDGSSHEVSGKGTTVRHRGAWKDGAFEYHTEIVRESDATLVGSIRTRLTPTAEGLLVRAEVLSPAALDSTALYRHPQDIALPAPAKAAIGDVAWIAGAWVGARGKSSIEERWTAPRGGALLGVSRTVSGERMVAFEFLRIVERDEGLVYIAQPGGAPPTEFTLVEHSASRAVFSNPRHDSPQRIVYELASDGAKLTASIGFASGGRPQRFEFERESP